MIEFADQVKLKVILQLIEIILWVLQKLLRYINRTVISMFTVPILSVSFACLDLNLNDFESTILWFTLSLHISINLL